MPVAPGQPTSSPFFSLWQQADQWVPTPFLYYWIATSRDSKTTTRLAALRDVVFVYSVGNSFCAHLTAHDGQFSPATLVRESPAYRFMPISGRTGLITPETAEHAITDYLPVAAKDLLREYAEPAAATSEESEVTLIARFHQTPWKMLRLERPMRAGQVEPVYRFLKVGSQVEFIVGAASGRVQTSPAPASP